MMCSMPKRGFLTLIFFLCTLPVFSYALTIAELQVQLDALLLQLAGLQAQQRQAVSTPSSATCPALNRALARGATGGDVTELQQFLVLKGYLHVEPTGFFGPLTEQAVRAFQTKEGIVASGLAQTTGWGAVGPKTHAVIAARCATAVISQSTTSTTPAVCAPISSSVPNQTCVGIWQKIFDSKGCHTGWQCTIAMTPSATNKAPTIHHVDGPVSAYVNEMATWTVFATDPENGSLSYSAVWGDEGADSLLSFLAGYGAPSYSTLPRISHSFQTAGIYSPEIKVRDAAGNETAGKLSIQIIPRPATTTMFVGPTPAASGSCVYNGTAYPSGTETEGYTINDLCLATSGICSKRDSYVPKFKCSFGLWEAKLENPYPNLPTYGNTVGTGCSSHGATKVVSVGPSTQICRGTLCAISQNYTTLSLSCAYTNWVDWGLFRAGATTTTICANPTPCEYGFGETGRACSAKQNGACEAAPYSSHPLGY